MRPREIEPLTYGFGGRSRPASASTVIAYRLQPEIPRSESGLGGRTWPPNGWNSTTAWPTSPNCLDIVGPAQEPTGVERQYFRSRWTGNA